MRKGPGNQDEQDVLLGKQIARRCLPKGQAEIHLFRALYIFNTTHSHSTTSEE